MVVLKVGVEPDPAKRIRRDQGKMIRKCRMMRDMSMHDLAVAVGKTEGAVSQWENGRYTPRQDVQVRIAKALEMPWSAIFGLDGQAA